MKLYELALHKSTAVNIEDFDKQIEQFRSSNDLQLKQLISKLYFQIPNTNIGIPASTFRHDSKKHLLGSNDWKQLIKHINDPVLYVEAKKSKAFKGINYLYKYRIHNKFYGVGACITKQGWLITTFFQDKEANIDNWLKGNGKAQPEMPTAAYVPGCSLSEGLNNIIPYKEEKINPLLEQKAYHGSNNEFDKFNPDKIKDYRYGWGFYFTTDKKYAQDYGKIKEYEIPEEEYLLDWENSYDYQSETVQDALYELWKDIRDKDTEQLFEKALFGDYCNNGYWIYNNLSQALQISAKETSLLMYKYGIKGIYSLDGNCFVIFNENDIENTFAKLNEQLQKFLNIDNLQLKD